jgi:hypothetical protein
MMFATRLMMFFRTSLQVHSLFTFNLVLIHQYNTNNQQFVTRYQLNFSRFLPDMFVRWDLKKSENITYNFNVVMGLMI